MLLYIYFQFVRKSISPVSALCRHRVRPFLQRRLPLIEGYRGTAFFVREEGKLRCTRLLLVVLVIECSDVIFAVDSVVRRITSSKDIPSHMNFDIVVT